MTKKNVENYMKTHMNCLHSVRQVINMFDKNSELLPIINGMVEERDKQLRCKAEKRGLTSKQRRRLAGKKNKTVIPTPRELTVIGLCKCGGVLEGEPMPGCETKKTGRIFYAQCQECDYYREVIREGDRVFERGNLNGTE